MPDLDAVRLRQKLHTERAFFWIVIIALVIVVIIVGPGGSRYAISVDGKAVAWVDSSRAAHRVEKLIKGEYETKVTGAFGKSMAKTLRFKESIAVNRKHPENSGGLVEKAALNALRRAVTPEVRAAVILVAGKPVVALPTRHMGEATLDGVKLRKSGGDPNRVSEVRIKGGAKVEERFVDLALVRSSVDEAIAYLLGGQEKTAPSPPGEGESTYAVQAGDTGTAIARKLHCSLSELQQRNPEVDWTKLKVGDTLKVPRGTGAPAQPDDPNLSVVATQEVTETETIPFKIERRRSLKLNPGEEEVRRKGVRGECEVRYRIHLKNGKKVKREEIDRRVVKQPVNEEILVGGKQ